MSSLPHIPSLTPTAPLWSYYGCIKYLFSNKDLIQEGYEKYKGHAFKIPEPLRWSVVITGPKLIDELRKVPADVLDMHEAGKEVIQAEYTLDHRLLHNYYHVPLVRSTLTRSLAILFPDIRDEISQAFSTLIPPSDDWVAVPALETVLQIVSRSTNRVIVGLPLARDPDFVKLNIDFAIDLFMGGQVIGMLPHFLRTLAVRWFTNVPSTIARATKHLEPIIKFRLEMMSTYGKDYDNKPNDFLSWLIDEAEGGELAVHFWSSAFS
ncbi:hypothetical protein QCA50_000126 [Cerrena zonata]|uniref:Cytochrome P450 n=1 Tax=Cerrena zonata TaxID=2478898 RepID=A0AAW0GQK5_9APHY